ncbi:MAG TPA: FumA C-terminus/TtdB family hydratase beta subunit [Candidatus Omnitrophota bacterium]|nr:FumA C-terminus/TtdB family hydratase beta subunit [Candidatus Omnitrophota bacterium]HPT39536.1 FumA C-terminus/TtdB family hydratase beta subunit [Candidatus Omnitrophota bacterium]
MKIINTPLDFNKIKFLKAGQEVLLSGTIYTARDQAHKKLVQGIQARQTLPFNLVDAVIYYCGPTQTPRGKVIGSCGPTTSSRMDTFTGSMLAKGLRGMIGKGSRSVEVRNAIKKHKGIYFVTYAGCGALLSKYVKCAQQIAYGELGPEAVFKLEVENFPLIVAIDYSGNDIYKGTSAL